MSKLAHKALRKQVIETCLAMNAQGINQGTLGNVSTRTEDGFLISASGIPYHRMKPLHVVEMDLDGGYRGDFFPSTEWRMHLDIYKNSPEAGAVIHVHSNYATALACLRKEVPAFHYMIAVTLGTSLRVTDYAEFGTQELSATMLKAMEGRNACLLANHGQICFAPNLDKALQLAGEIEMLCHQYWAALLAGKPVLLNEAEMASVLKRFKTYGKQAADLTGLDASEFAVVAPAKRQDMTASSMVGTVKVQRKGKF